MTTNFPAAEDPPLNLTDRDLPSADHVNAADERARAVQAKVGVNGSTDRTTIDYRTRHLAIFADGKATAPGPVVLWTGAVANETMATIDVDLVAANDDAEAALGMGLRATLVCKLGVASFVGSPLLTHDQRTYFDTAALAFMVDGASNLVRLVWLDVGLSSNKVATWTVRGTVATAKAGGM